MKIKFNPDKAREYIEGYGEGEKATAEEKLHAWAYMIATGHCWQIRPLWIGRAAKDLITKGVISDTGKILNHKK